MNRSALLATASAFAALAPLSAGAVTLDWSVSGLGSGTITATTPGVAGVHTATGITGTFQGSGLTLLPANSWGGNDNLVYYPVSASPTGLNLLDFDGVSFSYNGGKGVGNLYGYTTGATPGSCCTVAAYQVKYNSQNSGKTTHGTVASASVSVAATPLPASLPLFAGGAAVVGLVARRRKKKAAAVAGA